MHAKDLCIYQHFYALSISPPLDAYYELFIRNCINVVVSRIGPTFLGAYLLVWKKTRSAVVYQLC